MMFVILFYSSPFFIHIITAHITKMSYEVEAKEKIFAVIVGVEFLYAWIFHHAKPSVFLPVEPTNSRRLGFFFKDPSHFSLNCQ